MDSSATPYKDEFREEDFEKINEKYFKKARLSSSGIIDPSGWQDTYTPVKSFLTKKHAHIHKYNTDFGRQLIKEKQTAVPLLNAWDLFEYNNENFTLCHSATVASVILLSVLSKLGIKTIFFETPCYYAAVYQAKDLGLNTVLVPTYYQEDFKLTLDVELINQMGPSVIWITQPRTSLGFNQDIDLIRKILTFLRPGDYLVIDEATEQYFPSHLAEFNVSDHNIIKIRSFFKGMGLNGIRLSYLAHAEKLRDKIVEEMEIYQGALDLYSMNFLCENAGNISRFKMMLEASRSQIADSRSLLAKASLNNNYIHPSTIINGYIGCLFLHYPGIGNNDSDAREALLEFCGQHKMPLIFGSSMRFAIHCDIEFVRLNYYNRFNHLHDAIKKLDLFFLSL